MIDDNDEKKEKTLNIMFYGTGATHKKVGAFHLFGLLKKDLSPETTIINDGPHSIKDEIQAIFTKKINFNEKLVEKNYQEIKKWVAENGKTTLNLSGHSRGGINCIKLANRIASDPELKNKVVVNMLLLDPVPGINLKKDKNSYTIPENVENITAVYSSGEKRIIMKPQSLDKLKIENPFFTKIKTIIHPGVHTSGVYGGNRGGFEDDTPIAKMISLIAYKFFKDNGSSFNKEKEDALIPKYTSAYKIKKKNKDRKYDHIITNYKSEGDYNEEMEAAKLAIEEIVNKRNSKKKKIFNNILKKLFLKNRKLYHRIFVPDYSKEIIISEEDKTIAKNVFDNLIEVCHFICNKYIEKNNIKDYKSFYAQKLKHSLEGIDKNNKKDILKVIKETCIKMKKEGINSNFLRKLENIYQNGCLYSPKNNSFTKKLFQTIAYITGISIIVRKIRAIFFRIIENDYLKYDLEDKIQKLNFEAEELSKAKILTSSPKDLVKIEGDTNNSFPNPKSNLNPLNANNFLARTILQGNLGQYSIIKQQRILENVHPDLKNPQTMNNVIKEAEKNMSHKSVSARSYKDLDNNFNSMK